jgi:hypothetical protein
MTGLTAENVLGKGAEDAIPGWEDAVPQIPVGDAR